jgi:large repetitive protein
LLIKLRNPRQENAMRKPIPALLLLAFASFGFQAAPARPTAAAPPKPAARPAAPVPVLEGIVKGPDGKPLAQALVAARPIGGGGPFFEETPTVTARTDEAGRFKMALKSARPHNVRVEFRGLAARTIDKVRPGEPLSVTLQKGGAISGTVRDGTTGEPIARARVEAREESGFGPSVPLVAAGSGWEPGAGVIEATTDDKGRFRLEGVASGLHSVSAAAKGYGRVQRASVRLGGQADLVLFPGSSITGTVLGPEGQPIAGAMVRVEGDFSFRAINSSGLEKTDAKGRFEIVGLEAGLYRVVARHPDFAPGVASGIAVERSGDVQADLVLERGTRIVGRLVGSSERPVAGRVMVQELAASRMPHSLDEVFRVDAGTDGVFQIVGIPSGSHVLVATAPGYAAQRVEVDVRPRTQQTNVGDIALETGMTIRGRVTDKAGSPIAEAQIRGFQPRPGFTSPAEGRSEGDGTFAIGGLSAGTYRLSVSAAGYGNTDRQAEAGAENVEVVLQAAGQITGQVVDDAGRPVDAFRVSAQPKPQEGFGMRMVMPPRLQPFAGTDGRFTLEGVSEGTYAVTASAPERADGTVSNVKVEAGGTTDVGRVRLSAGGTIRGSVVDLTGTPIPAANIFVRSGGRQFFSFGAPDETTSDSSGAFEIKGVKEGTHEVVANHPQYAEGRVAVEVDAAKGPAEAKIVMSQGGRIEGSVRKRDGSGIPGQYVQVMAGRGGGPMSGPNLMATSAEGTFVVEHVAPGQTTVTLMSRSGDRFSSSQMRDVDVREGETSLVEFKSREILVSGHATRSGEPVANLRLEFRGEGGMMMMMSFGPGTVDAPASGPQRMTAVTREDGSYETLVEQPGRLQVTARSADGKTSYPGRSVEVADIDSQVVDLNYSGVTVAGVVVDRDTEQPLANAQVFAAPKDGVARMVSHAETGADGRFLLELDPGDYSLNAHADGYAGEETPLDVGESSAPDVRLALSRGLNIRGKVVDVRGRGVGGVFVFPISDSGGHGGQGGSTQPDGTFDIAGLGEGSYNLSVGSDLLGYGFRAGVQAGQMDVVLTLRPGGKVLLTVRGPDGAPVEGAWAMIARIGGARAGGYGARTNGLGVAEMGVPAGALELEVNKEQLKGQLSLNVAEGASVPGEVRLGVAPANAPKAVSK